MTIMRHGKPVAALIGISDYVRLEDLYRVTMEVYDSRTGPHLAPGEG